jgi:hypothetical protein
MLTQNSAYVYIGEYNRKFLPIADIIFSKHHYLFFLVI